MSRMGDLQIDIVTDLSKISKEFEEAIECGCNACESYTINEIDKQFKLVADTWAKANPLRLVKAKI